MPEFVKSFPPSEVRFISSASFVRTATTIRRSSAAASRTSNHFLARAGPFPCRHRLATAPALRQWSGCRERSRSSTARPPRPNADATYIRAQDTIGATRCDGTISVGINPMSIQSGSKTTPISRGPPRPSRRSSPSSGAAPCWSTLRRTSSRWPLSVALSVRLRGPRGPGGTASRTNWSQTEQRGWSHRPQRQFSRYPLGFDRAGPCLGGPQGAGSGTS